MRLSMASRASWGEGAGAEAGVTGGFGAVGRSQAAEKTKVATRCTRAKHIMRSEYHARPPTHEHFVPGLVSLGASLSQLETVRFPITGFTYGSFTKRSVQFG